MTYKMNTQKKNIGDSGLHKLIFVLL